MILKHPNRNNVKTNNHTHGYFCRHCDSAIITNDNKCPICGKRNITYKKRFSISTQKRIKEQ